MDHLNKKILKIGILVGFIVAFGGRVFSEAIHEFAQKGNLEGVKAQIAQNPELVNVKDKDGRTPLHWACRGVHLDIVKYLVQNGADVNAEDSNKVVPLHSLAVRNSTEAIEILLTKGADVNLMDYSSHSALHHAAMNDAADAADLLIKNGADIDIRDDYKRTPLILCARERGGPKSTLVFLKAGADVNARDKFNDTALNLASWKGKKEVVDLLMEFGANIPSRGRDVNYLFSEAASHDLNKLFDAVVKAGGDPFFKLSNGGTLLHSAAAGGSSKIIEILIEEGANINLKDNYGWTPLHYAARDGRIEAANKMIDEGADINARSIMGQSPFNAADEMKQDKVMALLLEKGAEAKSIQFPILEGNYMGQKPPGETPELFAPGIVSSIWGLHSTAAFSSDNTLAMWSPMIQIPGELYSRGGILMSEWKSGHWTAPRFAPFAENGDGDVPFFSPDGKRLYFMSAIAPPGEPQSRKERIWYVDRTADDWSAPKVVDASVNDYPHHWQFSVDANHTLFFSSSVPNGYGEGDIYFSKLEDGKWQKPENLGPPVNTDAGEGMPFIAPDSSYILFSRNYDLYISYPNKDGTWTEAINLGKSINSPSIDICPIVTPDGKFLFFLSQRGGESHIWWVDAGFIEKLKPIMDPEVFPISKNIHRMTFPYEMRSNIGISTGSDGFLLLDTGFSSEAVTKIRSTLKSIGKGDIKVILNTHPHWDHIAANSIGDKSAVFIDFEKLDSLESKGVVSRANKSIKGRTGKVFETYYTTKFNDEEIRLIPYPGVHSDGDILIHFMNSGVVQMGDLLLSQSFPAVGDSVADYLVFLEKVLDIFPDKTIFISGHGKELSLDGVGDYYEMLVDTVEIVKKGIEAGKSIEDLKKERVLREYESYGKLLPFLNADSWIANVFKCFQEK